VLKLTKQRNLNAWGEGQKRSRARPERIFNYTGQSLGSMDEKEGGKTKTL